ncbi:DapH/DapD/GlmU-related protein [Pseudomonas piscis]|uniref:DapH/DapD/GlmU-related protein n=1 Tax=Pseudomonas piscis TaxID=2614538 RepID=UPI00384BE904
MKLNLETLKKNHIFLIYKPFRKIFNILKVFINLKINPFTRKKCNLGLSPRILGVENIHISGDFSMGDHLWLEAISEYREQKFKPRIEIGDNFSASDFVHIACINNVSIGKNVLIGSKAHITDHAHGVYNHNYPSQSNPTTAPIERPLSSPGHVIIEDNVWIGDNVVILPNTTIGSGSIIGANSVVSKSIPKNVIAVGIPAKPIKGWDEEQEKWINLTP